MPKTKNPQQLFRYLNTIRLPIEWQEALNKAYKDFALDQVNQGKNPCKTDFVRHIFQQFLNK